MKIFDIVKSFNSFLNKLQTSNFQTKDEPISVVHKGETYPGTLVYRTPDNMAYDVAILTTNNHRFKSSLKFAREMPTPGNLLFFVCSSSVC